MEIHDCPFEPIFPSQLSKNDEFFMAYAYNEAISAYCAGEVPVGAVAVLGEEIIASDHNRVRGLNDPTAHAEVLVLSRAAGVIGDWRLNALKLYVTKEPCPMCSGACISCRVGEVVYGFSDPKMGCLGGAINLVEVDGMNHRPVVRSGVLSYRCHEIIRYFFQQRRKER